MEAPGSYAAGSLAVSVPDGGRSGGRSHAQSAIEGGGQVVAPVGQNGGVVTLLPSTVRVRVTALPLAGVPAGTASAQAAPVVITTPLSQLTLNWLSWPETAAATSRRR